MADKTETKLHRVAGPSSAGSGPSDDPTQVETAGPTAFDPYRCQTHEVQLEDRLKWLATDLPSIDRKLLEDTVPPNAARPRPASPPQAKTEHRLEEVATQTFATPAHVTDASANAATQQTVPSLRRVKREAAELTALQRSNLRRRRAMVAAFVGLFFVLVVGVFAAMGQDKSVSPNPVTPSSAEGSDPARQPSARESLKPAPPDRPDSLEPTSAAPHVNTAAPAVPVPSSAASPKPVQSAGAAPAAVPHSRSHRDAAISEPKPVAPVPVLSSAPKPLDTPAAVPPSGRVLDKPVNPALE